MIVAASRAVDIDAPMPLLPLLLLPGLRKDDRTKSFSGGTYRINPFFIREEAHLLGSLEMACLTETNSVMSVMGVRSFLDG